MNYSDYYLDSIFGHSNEKYPDTKQITRMYGYIQIRILTLAQILISFEML